MDRKPCANMRKGKTKRDESADIQQSESHDAKREPKDSHFSLRGFRLASLSHSQKLRLSCTVNYSLGAMATVW